MADPMIELSETGWIGQHREQYKKDPEKGHMWDSTIGGGPGPLPTLLLTTNGRKSGKESCMPLLYGKVDGGFAIIASKGGAPKHPGWYPPSLVFGSMWRIRSIGVRLIHAVVHAAVCQERFRAY